MNRQWLQLLGAACMMIASKYEEICAPQIEEFCNITDNTYFKEEVLQMESAVLNYLKFEMTAPTAKCFLWRFVRAAQGINELEYLSQLHCRIISLGVQYALPCSITYSCFGNFLGQLFSFPSKETMEFHLAALHALPAF